MGKSNSKINYQELIKTYTREYKAYLNKVFVCVYDTVYVYQPGLTVCNMLKVLGILEDTLERSDLYRHAARISQGRIAADGFGTDRDACMKAMEDYPLHPFPSREAYTCFEDSVLSCDKLAKVFKEKLTEKLKVFRCEDADEARRLWAVYTVLQFLKENYAEEVLRDYPAMKTVMDMTKEEATKVADAAKAESLDAVSSKKDVASEAPKPEKKGNPVDVDKAMDINEGEGGKKSPTKQAQGVQKHVAKAQIAEEPAKQPEQKQAEQPVLKYLQYDGVCVYDDTGKIYDLNGVSGIEGAKYQAKDCALLTAGELCTLSRSIEGSITLAKLQKLGYVAKNAKYFAVVAGGRVDCAVSAEVNEASPEACCMLAAMGGKLVKVQ
ncbi:MAG: hypothetical protein IJF71_04430 [Clostridia bacterium]|nr:hypothetical protein [Clostridia bacterium]